MSDIYQAPESELTTAQAPSEYGSVEKGLSGDYSLDIGAILKESWDKTSGNKGTIWLAFLIYMAVTFLVIVIAGIAGALVGVAPEAEGGSGSVLFDLVIQVVTGLVVMPLMVGIIFVGVKISIGEKANATSILSWYDKMVPLFVTYVLMSLMILIGFILLVIPGIYLSIAYTQAMPLVADKGLGPWEALETSRKTITHKWFNVFVLYIVVGMIMLASMLVFGIPLIWTLPMITIASAMVYRNAFGIEASTLAR